MEPVEREAELARLERTLARAAGGQGGVVVVSGGEHGRLADAHDAADDDDAALAAGGARQGALEARELGFAFDRLHQGWDLSLIHI